MRLVSYDRNGETRVGVVEGSDVRDAGTDLLNPQPGSELFPLDKTTLLAAVPRPGKIICIGLNYKDHAAEAGAELPTSPLVFAKFNNTIAAPGEDIRIPSIATQVDYEAELGVMIGKRAVDVPKDKALDHVYGYTCINDVSARDLQFADGQWTRGKSIDSFCPVGPWVVTSDEIPDPQTLGIRCIVNGNVLQDSNTGEMIFSVADVIASLSKTIALEPGDLIATGTPAGVGFARSPQIFLRPGDTVVIEIDEIGRLENPVVAR